MTREEFIDILDRKGYSYEIEGDKIIVTNEGTVYLGSLTSLPSGVEFKNVGNIFLDSLRELPSDVEFKNGGGVWLDSLTSLPPGLKFKNKDDVYLDSLTSLPPGVVFKNADVQMGSLIGGWLNEWKGNIEGIDSKRLLNFMISKGMFI
jgi:hypothetical protein